MSENNKNNKNNSRPYEKLVVGMRSNLAARLADLMSRLLNSSQDNLLDMSEAAGNNKDQTRYFELMNQLRVQKTSISITFDNQVKELLLPTGEFEARQQHKMTEQDDELSLVGENEMEGMVLVKSIGGRALSKYREQLQHLEARLEHLSLKTPTIFNKEALLPVNFCQAFNDALGEGFDSANKKILFSMFELEVANKLDALYDSINNRLIDADILPQIKQHTRKQQPIHMRRANQPGFFENPEAVQQSDSSEGSARHPSMGVSGMPVGNIGGYAMTAAPGEGYHNVMQNSLLSPAGDRHMGGATVSYADKESTGAEYQHSTVGMPASQVSHILGNFIGGMPFTSDSADTSPAASGNFYPETNAQHFGHQEIIRALSQLQNMPQFAQPVEQSVDAEKIKQAVLAEIAKTSGGVVTKGINSVADKTFDFIELIFDAIIDDDEISDAVKTLLLRLQIPIIKASMVDKDLFLFDDHPARVLLDAVADAGAGIVDHSDEIYKKLGKVISGILAEQDITTATFQRALDKLKDVTEELEASASIVEQEHQQQLLRKHARATVLKALRATTTGKSLPEAMHPLILKRWPTLMFNHYLKNGKENDEWVALALTLKQIVDSVQLIDSSEQLATLLAERDTLLVQAEKYLSRISTSKKEVSDMLAVYRATMQSYVDDANFTAEEVTNAEEAITNAPPVAVFPVPGASSDEIQDIPANVMPGMWFQVYMGEDQTAKRCKLSVIIVEDANLMFVDHKGELVTEKSFDEFNKEMANDSTKVVMGHSAFDHAFKTAIDGLN